MASRKGKQPCKGPEAGGSLECLGTGKVIRVRLGLLTEEEGEDEAGEAVSKGQRRTVQGFGGCGRTFVLRGGLYVGVMFESQLRRMDGGQTEGACVLRRV